MLNIIKYQLLNRLQTFRVAAPIVAGLNLLLSVIIAVQFAAGSSTAANTPGFFGFIGFLAIVSAVFVPLAHFFTGSSGHITEILKKDTGYLIMTLPKNGAQILGGRMLAGLIEFLAYLLVSFFSLMLSFVTISLTFIRGNMGITSAADFWNYLQSTVFGNLPMILKLLVMIVLNFAVIGSLISFAVIASASLVRNRKAATVLSVIGALFVFNRLSALGTFIGERFAPNARIALSFRNFQMNASNGVLQFNNAMNGNGMRGDIELNLVSALFMLCAAAGLFALSSLLLEKKLEV